MKNIKNEEEYFEGYKGVEGFEDLGQFYNGIIDKLVKSGIFSVIDHIVHLPIDQNGDDIIHLAHKGESSDNDGLTKSEFIDRECSRIARSIARLMIKDNEDCDILIRGVRIVNYNLLKEFTSNDQDDVPANLELELEIKIKYSVQPKVA